MSNQSGKVCLLIYSVYLVHREILVNRSDMILKVLILEIRKTHVASAIILSREDIESSKNCRLPRQNPSSRNRRFMAVSSWMNPADSYCSCHVAYISRWKKRQVPIKLTRN